MTSRNICFLIMLGFFLTFTFTGQLTDAQRPHRFKVQVNVTCSDENTGTLIQSYIKRELRSLGDVAIVSFDNATYILTIVALAETYKSGEKTGGLSLACVFLKKHVNEPDLYYYPLIAAFSSNVKEVDLSCRDIVADFDTKYLEPVRYLFQ